MVTASQKAEFVLEENNCHVLIDRVNKLVMIKWQGYVELDTAKKILLAGSNFIEDESATRILLNRKNLDQFSKETNKWIKDDLLKNRAKKLVHLVEKVATVKSGTTIGNLFSNLISTSIRIVFPGLKMKSYDNEAEALNWLTEK